MVKFRPCRMASHFMSAPPHSSAGFPRWPGEVLFHCRSRAPTRAPFGPPLLDNFLRPAQVATGRVVPLAGLLRLLDFDVITEVEPFEITAPITHLDVGRVAISLRCDVIGGIRDLSAKRSVEGVIGLPHERCPRHWSRSGQSKRARVELMLAQRERIGAEERY